MKNLLLTCFFLVAGVSCAQNPSDRDPSYNPYNLPLNSYLIPSYVQKFGSQSNNKILFVQNGDSESYTGKLIRLNDNLLDQSFSVTVTGGYIGDFCMMPNDKIVIVGNFTQCNGVARTGIARLNADGTIDDTFNVGTGYSGTISRVAPSNTGGVVFNGNGGFYNGITWNNNIVKINANGTLDQTFVYNDPAYGRVMKVQVDGKVIVLDDAGSFTRYLANGAVDATFTGYVNSTDNYITNFIQQPDGKIMIVGYFESYNGLPATGAIRLLGNGQHDATFTAPAFTSATADGKIMDIVRQADGKYVVCGKFTNVAAVVNRCMAQLNADGTHVTTSFTGYTDSQVQADINLNDFLLHQQPNGKIIFGGLSYSDGIRLHYQNQLVTHVFRTNADGTIDNTLLNPTKGFFPYGPSDVTQRIDGKLLIAPSNLSYTTFNNQEIGEVVQLNADWTIDQDFEQTIKVNLGGYFPEFGNNVYSVTRVKALDDGKLILMGGFRYTYAGTDYFNFVLLNPNGSVAYGLTNYMSAPSDFDVDPATGKILILGYNTFPGNGVIRILPSGVQETLNLSGSFGTLTNRSAIKYLPSGKFVIVANDNKRLYRFNNNGSYDSSFPSNIFQVSNPQIGGDGKLLYLNLGSSDLIKRNDDGTIDTAFAVNLQTIPAGYFNVQPDGKIIVLPPNISDITIRRLNADGTADSSFEVKAFDGLAPFVTTLRYGKIFVSGGFDRYNGVIDAKSVLLLGEDYYHLVGNNKFDNDVNGCTASDIDYPFLKYQVSNGSQTRHHIANYTGSYLIGFTEGDYTVTPQMENPEYFTISPSTVNVTFPAATNPQLQDFCIAPNGVHQDVEVVIIPLGQVHPGDIGRYKILYRNKGNVLVSGQINVTFPNTVMTLTMSNPVATLIGNQLSWTYTDLWPFESREIVVNFNLNTPTDNPPLNGEDILQLSASISPESGDEMIPDNIFNLAQTVVNSFDPNDKTCLEGNVVSEEYIGAYVHYLIRFENTGNGNAINITVTDNIDPSKYDIASLVPLSGSHPFYSRIEGNKVSFVFEDIELPFADDQNDGYVLFKIKLKNDLVVGDTFVNNAEIYFDFNSPIVTNTANTLIQTPMSVDESTNAAFVVYPNPVNDFCIIESEDQIKKVDIFSADGRLVRSVLNPIENRVDTSVLTSGYYFMRIEGVDSIEVVKLIKE